VRGRREGGGRGWLLECRHSTGSGDRDGVHRDGVQQGTCMQEDEEERAARGPGPGADNRESRRSASGAFTN
jgi:hypothetical protein